MPSIPRQRWPYQLNPEGAAAHSGVAVSAMHAHRHRGATAPYMRRILCGALAAVVLVATGPTAGRFTARPRPCDFPEEPTFPDPPECPPTTLTLEDAERLAWRCAPVPYRLAVCLACVGHTCGGCAWFCGAPWRPDGDCTCYRSAPVFLSADFKLVTPVSCSRVHMSTS